jgi:hypothetical protein
MQASPTSTANCQELMNSDAALSLIFRIMMNKRWLEPMEIEAIRDIIDAAGFAVTDDEE